MNKRMLGTRTGKFSVVGNECSEGYEKLGNVGAQDPQN